MPITHQEIAEYIANEIREELQCLQDLDDRLVVLVHLHKIIGKWNVYKEEKPDEKPAGARRQRSLKAS